MNPSSLFKEIAGWIGSECPEFEPLIASATGKNTCPSYPNDAGGTKFAVRLADGSFQFVAQDEEFDDLVSIQSTRSYGPCLTSRCIYWSGNCQLGTKIAHVEVHQPNELATSDVISNCPIQLTCRWRNENGKSACHGCTQVDYEVKYG